MLILDLRLTLFLVLLAVVFAGLLGAWLGRMGRQDASPPASESPADYARLRGSSGRLLNDLSHELRTPLATLLTHAEVLHVPNLTPEARDQSIELVRAEGRRMSRLLNLMLDLGRLDVAGELPLRPVDVGALATEAAEQMREALEGHGLRLIVEIDEALPQVPADADRLRQVLLNLLDNTVKHCRPGDTVQVRVMVDAPASGSTTGIRCAVCDSGPGIPPQHLPHLTERFYRAAPQAVEGSGLGLALVDEILRRHGSQLEIASKTEWDGETTGVPFPTGSCFSFCLEAA